MPSERAHRHVWMLQNMAWDNENAPAQSESVVLSAYCEKCEVEVERRYELEGTYDLEGDVLDDD